MTVKEKGLCFISMDRLAMLAVRFSRKILHADYNSFFQNQCVSVVEERFESKRLQR